MRSMTFYISYSWQESKIYHGLIFVEEPYIFFIALYNIHDNCDDDDRFNYFYDDDLSVDAKKWAGCWAASGLSGGLQLKLH